MPVSKITSPTTGPSCLIVGESSFLVLNLAQALEVKGCRVVVLNNQPNNVNPNKTFKTSIEWKEANLNRPLSLKRNFDYVFYFLGDTPSLNSHALSINLAKVKHLVELATKSSARLLIITSPSITPGLSLNKKTSSKEDMPTKTETIQTILSESKLDYRLLNLSEVFGPGMELSISAPIAGLFSRFYDNQIIITASQTQLISPLFITDAVEIIEAAMFGRASAGKTFYAEGEQSQTVINLAYAIQQIAASQGFQLSIVARSADKIPPARLLGEKLLSKFPTNLEAGLTATNNWLIQTRPPKLFQTNEGPNRQIGDEVTLLVPKPGSIVKPRPTRFEFFSLRPKFWLAVATLTLFIWFFSPPLMVLVSARQSLSDLEGGNLTGLKTWTSLTEYWLTASFSRWRLLAPVKNLNPALYDQVTQLIQGGSAMASSFNHASFVLESTGFTLKSVFDSTSPSLPFDQLSISQNHLHLTLEKLALAEAYFKNVSNSNIFLNNLKTRLPVWRQQALLLQELTQFAPALLGKDNRVNYLILLQNSEELRPTGGFIGSFIIITLENGKLVTITPYDVYAADGQLQGYVSPPPEIKTHLGEANWYLRDANWDPDFPTSARQAEWFLNKELNLKVEGTAAVDLYFVKQLLTLLGPLKLADYQETITADNLFERAEFYSEINFFPGSTQKRDFLGSLTTTILDRLKNEVNFNWSLISALSQSVTSSHFQFSHRDPSIAATLDQLNVSGALKTPRCFSTKPCFSDYASLIEANVGVNKANYFINRSLDYTVSLASATPSAQLVVTYHNSAETNTWPGGTYKNYLRLYTPATTILQQVLVNDQPLPTQKVDVNLSHGKKVYGWYLEVPPSATISTTISYQFAQAIPTTKPFAYNLLIEKQSGTDTDPLTVSLIPPPEASLESTHPTLEKIDNIWQQQTSLATDYYLTVDLTTQ